mmetsp:Transcript_22000/g.50261  ORF Transcript_22000/g.50261 Transcript_22000/m.50261 type:complete len:272 (-) Transcript_22000:133-948(-)
MGLATSLTASTTGKSLLVAGRSGACRAMLSSLPKRLVEQWLSLMSAKICDASRVVRPRCLTVASSRTDSLAGARTGTAATTLTKSSAALTSCNLRLAGCIVTCAVSATKRGSSGLRCGITTMAARLGRKRAGRSRTLRAAALTSIAAQSSTSPEWPAEVFWMLGALSHRTSLSSRGPNLNLRPLWRSVSVPQCWGDRGRRRSHVALDHLPISPSPDKYNRDSPMRSCSSNLPLILFASDHDADFGLFALKNCRFSLAMASAMAVKDWECNI